MSAKKKGARILGPYKETAGYRVIEIDPDGERESVLFPTEEKATRYIEILQAEVARQDHTTATALDEYEKHLRDLGDKDNSIDTTRWAIETFFPDEIPLTLLSSKRC